MKTIFLTGATGVMGSAGLDELLKTEAESLIRVLVRPSAKNREKMAKYASCSNVEVVWGDLTSAEDVMRGVAGSDVVLHVGGMVSPKADYFPKSTRRVNVEAAQNIVDAVKAQPNADQIKVVYIGTVAQTGSRPAPIHWGRTGDPIFISVYDHYAISKTKAERIIADSGLKRWVSLRQSGILYPGILRNYDPIMFHVPINGVLEWATVEDSARLLANVCADDVPDEFWNRFYNIGSGEQYRITNFEFERRILGAISCPAPEKIFNANWFATRNFHGQWYADSDVLEEYLHFRANIPLDDYFDSLSRQVPRYFKLAAVVPAWIIKNLAMRPLVNRQRLGTMRWIKEGDQNRVSAYFGSVESWREIPSWSGLDTTPPTQQVSLLNHGYDESRPLEQLTREEIVDAARFRGGELVSEGERFDPAQRLRWRCCEGHEFEASLTLVLKGGHWCDECLPSPWSYAKEAKHNAFFRQVYAPQFHPDEKHFYPESIFDGWE